MVTVRIVDDNIAVFAKALVVNGLTLLRRDDVRRSSNEHEVANIYVGFHAARFHGHQGSYGP
jgi:hypothetical protein